MTALSTDKLEARDLRNLDHILRDPLSGLTWDNRIMAADAICEVLADRKAEAWRPISSAPKDGTTVMVYVPDFEKITEAWFCEQTGLWPHSAAYSDEGEPCNVGQPTHWRPLPEPPTTPEAEGGCDD